MTNHEMCGEVQAQADPLEMQDGGQATFDELRQINVGTTDDPKPIFVSTILNDEEVVQYEQLLWEYRCVFAWGYQGMLGLDLNVAVHKLPISEGVNR